jgi:flagellar hook-basal body complex protein FliE
MVNGIGGGGGMAREAIAAAMRAQQQAAQNISGGASLQAGQGLGATEAPGASGPLGGVGSIGGTEATSFAKQLSDGLSQVTDRVAATDQLPEQMLNGEVSDFHDVAIQLKQSDLSFRFALQVRNKLIDAYREVMRV